MNGRQPGFRPLPVFSARGGEGFLISLRGSNRYSQSYLTALEISVAFLAEYAENHEWPPVDQITTSHIEEYVTHFQTRPRWFGERGEPRKTLSQSYIETQYRRLKRFFNWMVERGHVEGIPFNLIPHPHIDQRTIPVVSDRQAMTY